MREGAAAVAVAECPDAWNVGGKGVVDGDVAARIGLDAGAVEAEIVGVRTPPNGQQDVRPDDRGCAFEAVNADCYAFLVRHDGDALGAGSDANALAQENVPDRF